MKIDSVEKAKDGSQVRFALKSATPAFANTLRRLYTAEVPTLAVEDVEFKDNSSILYDETVALRLGLLPLKTDLSSYKLREEVEGDGIGSAECEVKVSLSAQGPCTVYASDLKIADPAVKAVYPKMPIAKLIENQKLEFEAIAILGRGKENMKWSPGHLTYSYDPKKNDEFTMTVETWGQLTIKEGLQKAAEILEKKADELTKALA